MAKSSAQLNAEIKAALNGAKHGILARRKTADDKVVMLHADGTLTWALGSAIKGSPNARTAAGIEEALTAGWLVMDNVELYDADDVPRLIAVTRKVAHQGGNHGDVRRAFAKQPPLKPHWTTLEADRDGKPTIRVWRLPRMSHPGLAVWDTLRNASRGRYEVMMEVRAGIGPGRRSERESGTYATTGVRFNDLDKLSQYLRETSQL
jgi:hypothetical protein